MRVWKWVFCALLSSASLWGGVEMAFKEAADKGDGHSIRSVDFIYMINLDQRPEKFDYCQQQLGPHGIIPYRFSAVNGWELPLKTINLIAVHYEPWMRSDIYGTYFAEDGQACDELIRVCGRPYFCHKMTRGAIGIVLSHLSVLQDAYESGYETIWVMEDDVQVVRDPHRLSCLIERLDGLVGKDGWDILFTDQDTKGRDGNYVICRSHAPRPNFDPADPALFAREPTLVSDEFRRVFARYGAYSMIIRRSGVKKLLDFFKTYKVFLPYDMDFYLPKGIRLYCVTEDVVSTKPDALSDNGRPGYRLSPDCSQK